jgi:hypothetical protein
MTTKQLNYKALPIITAADGATSPALTANDKGAMAFSTTTNKPMSWDGTKWNVVNKVDSVAGRTGVITLTKTDVGLGSVDDVSAASLRDRTTHTGVQAISSITGLQTALDGKAATGHSHSEATTAAAGFMSSADKTKLNSIDSVALLNRVNHTGAQAISTITGLQTAIDGKASTGHSHSDVTTTSNGFMTSADKIKLDGIVPANLLSRANHTGTQAISTIDTLQSTLDTKASTGHSHTEATVSAKGFMSSADKAKLDGIVTANLLDRANHTGAQAISTITGLQTAIDGRASSGHSHSEATTSAGGFMSSADKIKLNSLNSVDLLNRVNHTGEQAIATVTGLQAALNTKAATTHSHSDVTTTSNGFMTAADKIKLDGIVTANLLNRANHTGEQAIATVTGLQTALNGKASTTHTHADATTTVAGFMSSSDKTKLDGIVTANLVNRANHTGEQAISSVTGLQAALDTKASTAHTHANATSTVAGFMSNADKVKLDGVATGANNYAHPANHPASIITQDASNRFVTDAEKTAWNAKLGAVKTINGQSIVGSGNIDVDSSRYINVTSVNPINALSLEIPSRLTFTLINANTIYAAGDKVYISLQDDSNFVRLIGYIQNPTTTQIDVDVSSTEISSSATDNYSNFKILKLQPLADTFIDGLMSNVDKTKLNGIVTANLLNRANHTGAQAISTVSGLQVAIDGKAATTHIHVNATTTTNGFMSSGDKSKVDMIKLVGNNVGFGQNSILNVNGSHNTGFGIETLTAALTVKDSTAFGYQALKSFSHAAGTAVTDGGTVAIGYQSIANGTQADRSVAVGAQSLLKGGRDNVAIGYRSTFNNTNGYNNVAVGSYSLLNNVAGTDNAFVGFYSGVNVTGRDNVGVGSYAGGEGNCSNTTAIGHRALQNNFGSNNIGIGNGSRFDAITTGSNNIIISASSPCYALASTDANRIVMGSTVVTNAYIKVAWTVVSDARDKTNFAPVPHGLEFVKQLKPTAYQFRESRESEATNGGVRYGFKAQDIAAIEPEAVIVDTTNPEKLYYNESNLIAVMVKAIQELTAKVERLENANSNT